MSVYYVGPGGSDANNGTSYALRKLTLNGAEDIPVAAGDQVYVSPGTYRESLTVDVSGSSGNVITYIGDYTGANTSGTKGVVRITGSNDDISATRASCIVLSSKNYRTFTGFLMDTCTSSPVSLTTATYVTIDQCNVIQNGASGAVALDCLGASQSNVTISRCYVMAGSGNAGIRFSHSSTLDNAAHVVENCLVLGAITSVAANILSTRIGGITVRNCTIGYGGNGIYINTAVTAGQTLTVNNCQIWGHDRAALRNVAADGAVVENYNNLCPTNAALRANVTAGANSVSRPVYFDPRWFFEMVNGGRMVTPFDLASYSTLVEYNSGTGAPSTDIRGASVVGTYREWGALEYSANNRAQGPVSIAPIGGIG